MTERELVERLECLEGAHRRLKGFAVAPLVVTTALVTMYATQSAPQKITAREFDIVDNSGVQRMRMNVNGINISDADGVAREGLVTDTDGSAVILLLDAQGVDHAAISVSPQGAPAIRLADSQGFQMNLGSTGKVNFKAGTTEKTSAASIVMFGKDEKHHLIWQAP
jgi:hypothetical protein